MEQRALRNEIFKILFEHELVKNDVEIRVNSFLEEHSISKQKEKFFREYIQNYISKEKEVEELIKPKLKGWIFSRLGVVEKVLLKMAFFEIKIEDIGFEIVINEALELANIYGDVKTKKFINGILADLVRAM